MLMHACSFLFRFNISLFPFSATLRQKREYVAVSVETALLLFKRICLFIHSTHKISKKPITSTLRKGIVALSCEINCYHEEG